MTLREVLRLGVKLIRYKGTLCTKQWLSNDTEKLHVNLYEGNFSNVESILTFDLDTEIGHLINEVFEFEMHIKCTQDLITMLSLSDIVPVDKKDIRTRSYRIEGEDPAYYRKSSNL